MHKKYEYIWVPMPREPSRAYYTALDQELIELNTRGAEGWQVAYVDRGGWYMMREVLPNA